MEQEIEQSTYRENREVNNKCKKKKKKYAAKPLKWHRKKVIGEKHI